VARNVEIKARLHGVEDIVDAVAALADRGPIEIRQDDTFFACPGGRLKLRVLGPGAGELIFYRRADAAGPRESFYLRSPTSAPDTLRPLLAAAYGEVGRVLKQRTLYLAGRARIHLDRVEGLGHFLEIEVVLAEAEPVAAGVTEARGLLTRLGVAPDRLVEAAYVDLLAAGRTEPLKTA
jgi:adenylate cyclase class IV